MKLALANKIGFRNPRRPGEEARIRILLVALVSFCVGVAATASWFHLAGNRAAENSSSPANNPVNQADNPQPAPPASGANPSARAFVEAPVPVGPSAIEDVKHALPNYVSLSLDQGTEILRQAALKKYAAAAQELQNQVTQAQAELSQAAGKSPADQQAAIRHLQQVQAEQTQKLQQIGGELQTQIAALKQLKNAK